LQERENERQIAGGANPNSVLFVKYPRTVERERPISAEVLHQCVGHFGFAKANAFAKQAGYRIIEPGGSLQKAKEEIIMCESCMIGKSKVLPRFAKNHIRRATKQGVILHLDTQGPWRHRSRTGKLYKFSVTDDYSAYTLDFYLVHKNEFVACLFKAINFFETQTGNKVQEIVCDQEFTAPRAITDKYPGIIWKDAATGDKDGNPLAERMNQTTGGPARAMRHHAGFPPNFWDEMEHTASTIWNILPATIGPRKGMSPYEQLLGRQPPTHQLMPIGSRGVMHVGKKDGKGSMPGKIVTLVGYDIHRELYRVWDGHRVIAGVRNARFNPRKVGPLKESETTLDNDSVIWNDQSEGEYAGESKMTTTTTARTSILTEDDDEAVVAQSAVGKDRPISPFPVDDQKPIHTTNFDTEELGPRVSSPDLSFRAVEPDGAEQNMELGDSQSTANDTRVTIGPAPHSDFTSPSATHSSANRYQEGPPPAKGLTWEQSSSISSANIIQGKRNRKQTDLTSTSTHHVTLLDMDDCITRDEESEWLFYVHLPVDLREEGMTIKDMQRGIDNELKALQQFNTFQWVSEKDIRKAGIKPVGLLWVHKVKTDETGSKFVKSRLSLRGDQLVPGVSYNPDQLYVPCANHRSVLILFKLSMTLGNKVYGVDFKNAYLNALMKDPVYAKPPERATADGHEGMYWKVTKALYGAPQAGKRWYDLFAELLGKLGYRTLKSDPCMFIQKDKPLNKAVVGVFHVDDLIFLAPSQGEYERFCHSLEQRFPIKRLGLAREFKGMEIEQRENEIIVHQRTYARKVVKFFGYENSKPSATPGSKVDPQPMHKDAGLRKHSIPQIVGSLLFLAKMTRPDIDEAVNTASVLQTIDEGIAFARLGKCIRYLKNLRGLRYRAGTQKGMTEVISVWPDAAHRTCLKTGKSRTGYIILYGGDPVSWLSKRQSKVALSSNDAEIFAANEALRETMAIRNLLLELGVAQKQPIEVNEDNAQSILAAQRGLSGPRTKHLPLEEHYLHELEDQRIVAFHKVGTKGQLADVMTKYVPKDQQNALLDKFTVRLDQ